MIKYLFCHGFGFSANYWNNFTPLLPKGEANFIDLGYFNTPTPKNLLQDYDRNSSLKIGIGHSLGFMKLINSGVKLDILIGINAFYNFLGHDDLYQQRKSEYDQLLKQFYINPLHTLKRFYRRCGATAADLGMIDITSLTADLNFLIENVALPQDIPILIINSLDDIIVPPALTLANFSNHKNVTTQLLKSGSHSIILNNQNVAANLINQYLKNHV